MSDIEPSKEIEWMRWRDGTMKLATEIDGEWISCRNPVEVEQ